MFKTFKDIYSKSIKPIFYIKLLLTIITIILVVYGIMNEYRTEYVDWVFWIVSLMSFISGIEEILLKREKWDYILSFGQGIVFFFFQFYFSDQILTALIQTIVQRG